MVLSVTVLPPVLGPVMMSVSKSLPSRTEIGTTVLPVMSGWRARMRFSWPSVRTSGQMARMANDSRARAKMHSSSSSTS